MPTVTTINKTQRNFNENAKLLNTDKTKITNMYHYMTHRNANLAYAIKNNNVRLRIYNKHLFPPYIGEHTKILE